MAQRDAAGQLALRQRVTDLLEVFAQLVLTKGRLDTTGCPSGNEMASILLLQLFYLGMDESEGENLTIKHVYKALKLTDDTATEKYLFIHQQANIMLPFCACDSKRLKEYEKCLSHRIHTHTVLRSVLPTYLSTLLKLGRIYDIRAKVNIIYHHSTANTV